MDDDHYNPSEAAKVLGISKRQVTNLLNAGELGAPKRPPDGGASRRWRYTSC